MAPRGFVLSTGRRGRSPADHRRADLALSRSGELHPERDAADHTAQLSDYPQTLWLGDGGFTVTAVYTLQLLTLNGEQFIIARLIDTLIGCLIAFGGMVWLWPQCRAAC